LEVNKNGVRPSGAPNSSFFRKGEVGDSWLGKLSESFHGWELLEDCGREVGWIWFNLQNISIKCNVLLNSLVFLWAWISIIVRWTLLVAFLNKN
jgi:hypothetical protein